MTGTSTQVTVIDADARYDFKDIHGWVTDDRGYLDLLNSDGDYVARFAPGWRGVYQPGSEIPPEQGDTP
jgi:hypothetical protein